MKKKAFIAVFISAVICGSVLYALSFPKIIDIKPNEIQEATLLSLNPAYNENTEKENFYNFKILGEVNLSQNDAVKAVQILIGDNIDKFNGNSVTRTACLFSPRHGLTFPYEGHKYDVVMCFECGDIDVYKDGKNIINKLHVGGTPDVLNKMLVDAGIPLAEQDSQ